MKLIDILKNLFKYGMCSVFVTIIDVSIVYSLVEYFSYDIIKSNTIGVIAGFLIHYGLSIKNVFDVESDRITFLLYLATFLLGLLFANLIIWFCYDILQIGFLISKSASVVIPFFLIYRMRRTIYANMRKEQEIL